MNSLWRDDAPLDARRATAYERLMRLCPAPIRLLVGPMVQAAMENASDDELAALLVDLDTLPSLAEAGDATGIVALARRYGASDEMVDMYLPLFDGIGKSA